MEGGSSAAGASAPAYQETDTDDTEDASHVQEGNTGRAATMDDEDTETEDEGAIYAILFSGAARDGGSASPAASDPPVKKKAARKKAKAEGGDGEGGSAATPKKKRASGGGRKKKAAQEDAAEGDDEATAGGGKKRRSSPGDDSSTVASGKPRKSRGRSSLGPVAVRAAEGEATLLERCVREAVLDSSVLELPEVQALARVCRGLREVVRGATVALKGGPAVLRVSNGYPRLGRLTIVLDELEEEGGGWRVPSEPDMAAPPKRLTHVTLRVKHDTAVYPPKRLMHFGREYRLDEELIDITDDDRLIDLTEDGRPPGMLSTLPALSAQWERGFDDPRKQDKGKGKKAAGRSVRQLGTDTRVIDDPLHVRTPPPPTPTLPHTYEFPHRTFLTSQLPFTPRDPLPLVPSSRIPQALSPLSGVPLRSLTLALQLDSPMSLQSLHSTLPGLLAPWVASLTSLTLQTLYPLTPLHTLTTCLTSGLLPQLVHLEISAMDTRDATFLNWGANTQRRFLDALVAHAPQLRTLRLGKISSVEGDRPSGDILL